MGWVVFDNLFKLFPACKMDMTILIYLEGGPEDLLVNFGQSLEHVVNY